MGGDGHIVELGGIADGLHLLKAHLLAVDGGAQAHNAAGGHILDHIAAVLDVVAHRLDQLIRAVADGGGGVHLVVQIGAVVVIGVAAGGGDGTAGGHQAGTPVLAAVDGVPHRLIGKAVAADDAQRREACHQVDVGVLQGLEGPVGDGLIGLGHRRIGLTVHRKVHVAVDQAGGDELVAEVDDLVAVTVGLRRRDYRGDPLPVGEDHHILPDGAGGGVEHLAAFDRFVCHNGTSFLIPVFGYNGYKKENGDWPLLAVPFSVFPYGRGPAACRGRRKGLPPGKMGRQRSRRRAGSACDGYKKSRFRLWYAGGKSPASPTGTACLCRDPVGPLTSVQPAVHIAVTPL